MSCRRIRRELLWLVRFGDFDAGSAPHLDHLAGCQGCRDEIGLDRALVRQLRTALAERIGDATPSPTAWEGVLVRMRQPEPSPLRAWPAKLASLLRAGSAMAGASLALILALNLEMAPIGPIASPESTDLQVVTAGGPSGRGGGIRQWEGRAPAAGTGLDREADALVVWVPVRSEQLPLNRTVLAGTPGDDAPVEPADQPAGSPERPAVLRLVPFDEAAMSNSSDADAEGASDSQPTQPATPPVGGPS
jgi:hypothetical protein